MHRIRQAMGILSGGDEKFSVDLEVDETYIGGKKSNRYASKKLRLGRGTVGKKPVIGVKHRETGFIKARVIDDTTRKTLQGLIQENVAIRSQIYTDETPAYKNLVELDFKHQHVRYSVGEYVKGKA